MVNRQLSIVNAILAIALSAGTASAQEKLVTLPKDDGYRGIWYMNQPVKGPYAYKYSGGFATYPQQHLPIAYYAREANKTFFCYGGKPKDKDSLLHMVSYYDHATGLVPRPTILLDKQTTDAHDNPTMMLDSNGHIWIFSNSHGPQPPSYIHRSVTPYSIDAFERIRETNFSYGQPWWIDGGGFLFLHTLYRDKGRSLHWSTSADGRTWAEPNLLARIENGHYQVSWRDGNRVGTIFNFHPDKGGLNFRTNLYYLQTDDMGRTWRTADGSAIAVPLREVKNAALVHDYQSEGLLVFIKEVQFDAGHNPVLMYLTTKGWEPGPENGPRVWWTARWAPRGEALRALRPAGVSPASSRAGEGKMPSPLACETPATRPGGEWDIRRLCESDHNYDFGSLYIEADGTWRLIAPTDPGPQPWCTGGEVVMWTSTDQGATWTKGKNLTPGSLVNHTYVRHPVNANPGFYAFWADGNPLKPSDSSLYFATREGVVRRLPAEMTKEFEEPPVVFAK